MQIKSILELSKNLPLFDKVFNYTVKINENLCMKINWDDEDIVFLFNDKLVGVFVNDNIKWVSYCPESTKKEIRECINGIINKTIKIVSN